jgi:hypothetical protein
LEKSTSFNGKMNAIRHKMLQFIPGMGRIATFLCYTFNAQKSKYKGTGAGKAEQQRMGNN